MPDQPTLSCVTPLPPPDATVRVSFAALLRFAVNDRYVLFDTGRGGPPGGAFQYLPSAAADLTAMGFQRERPNAADLRGTLAGSQLPVLSRWFAANAGAHREDGATCLRRELGEELEEIGFGELSPLAGQMRFAPVRTIVEHGPVTAPNYSHQLRHLEIYSPPPAASRTSSSVIASSAWRPIRPSRAWSPRRPPTSRPDTADRRASRRTRATSSATACSTRTHDHSHVGVCQSHSRARRNRA